MTAPSPEPRASSGRGEVRVEEVGVPGSPAAPREERLPWALPPWVLPFWAAGVGWEWWKLGRRGLAAAGTAASSAGAAAAWLGVAARFAGFAAEAFFYVMLWAALGRRLRFWRFATWVLSLSALDLLAGSERATRAATHAPAAALLFGLGLASRHPAGATALFATFGLTTLARLACLAWAQARGSGARVRLALAVTAAVWLAGRFATLALAALARGRSAG